MAIRSITALHNGYDFEASSLTTAVSLSTTFGAFLRIIHAGHITTPTAMYFGEAAAVGSGVFEAIERQTQADLKRSRETAAAICRAHNMPFGEAASTELPRAQFLALENASNQRLMRALSMTDLIVKGAPTSSSGWLDDPATHLALFATTRPMLVVRPGNEGAAPAISGERACIAWRNAPEAMHAVLGARDLIKSASHVHILTVAAEGRGEPDEASVVVDYLAAHGVATAHETLSGGGGATGARAVLTRARELGCAYIVMGAYGHSMVREALLGGFSEEMINEAEFPLVLCH